ncbi:NAD(P)-binding protein [Phanerochaete sordida]|uniref:NAD(P)-binding protein n=1 Tax=Phanerochaete sordida TaxID=48140 RepID=A0A9P3LKI4_9APHY|nr:NAD(P)-binding protein [Phanerochaete sordida]
MAATGLTTLLLGATGATGKHLLKEVVSSEHFSKVSEWGRSVTAPAKLPEAGKEKLEQKTIDFDNLDVPTFKQGNWDVIFITLGTTRAKAGSAEAFERIDREYVLNAARAAKSDDPTRKQRLVYVSSGGSNPTSMFLYPKSKGLTEQALATLGYDDLIIFHPGLLMDSERPERRIMENIAEPIIGFLGRFSNKLGIPVETVARSIRIAGELGSEKIPADMKSTGSWGGPSFTTIDNAQALKLAKFQA